MLDDDHAEGSATTRAGGDSDEAAPAAKKTTRKRSTKKTATPESTTAPATAETAGAEAGDTPARKRTTKTAEKAAKTTKTAKTAKKTAAKAERKPAKAKKAQQAEQAEVSTEATASDEGPAKPAAKKSTTRKRAAKSATTADAVESGDAEAARSIGVPLFQAPDTTTLPARRQKADSASGDPETGGASEQHGEGADDSEAAGRRRRRRGGRRRRKPGGEATDEATTETAEEAADSAEASEAAPSRGESTSSRRRRRRRRAGEDDGDGGDDPANTVVKVRARRSAADEITAVTGSTRLEAKKQRRREGREAGRRRAPIVSEAEFLARREAVNRVMVIRQRDDVTQIGVLEDNVLVEHYVARESQTSLIGNVYLGRVQNVLPSMEAAFIDIGKGRNAVLYAGEVNWSALGHKDGQPRKIESVLSSGQAVLVQVTKDPVGHKGARLTSQISLAGRFLVYVPDGTTSGISRKLPDTERNRLKSLLKEIVPESAGVIVRTAAEGASEEELTRDVERLKARWDDIEKKAKGSAPQLLYGEPDLTLKVVRDLFTEDFSKLVIEGDDAWETVQSYVAHVAPDLEDRLERYEQKKDQDVFSAYRIDEQIKKGLDRKVWLPSGGSLVIDRTEAMTVIDVNTGKFTGSGGNLEETVTKNNLEAAEEIVRQLRLRDIGGIIVVDFIDMVLESNRDLVLRRLVECLGRDRTRHQVAEVTSLGLVQMTRKRIGTGLLESFSHDCPTCHGRGVVIEDEPVEPRHSEEEPKRSRRSRGRARSSESNTEASRSSAPSPKDVAAMARHHAEHEHADEHDEHDEHDEADEADELEPIVDEPVASESVVDEPAAEIAAEPGEAMDQSAPTDGAPTAGEAVVETESSAEATDVPEAPAEPEPPKVVTRSRRRAASRPAGPPATAAADPGTASESHEESTDAPKDHTNDGAPALHVPVKRKGSRKR
jgi:ribonuclease E